MSTTTSMSPSTDPLDDPGDPARWIGRYFRTYQRQVAPFGSMTDDDLLDFAAAWITALRRHGITEGEANAAALELAECPPQFTNRHLQAVLDVVESMRPGTNPVDATTAERLKRQREATIRAAKADQLAAQWAKLPAAERDRIRAEVVTANPGLAKFEPFVTRLCLARLQGVRA